MNSLIIVLGILGISRIGRAAQAQEQSSVYTCCFYQNTFGDSTCNQQQPLSEFDFLTHKAVWLVHKEFGDGMKEFELGLERRNSSKRCKSQHRIRYSNPGEQARIAVERGEIETSKSSESVKPIFHQNGTMQYKKVFYPPKNYCIDRLVDEDDSLDLDVVIFEKNCATQVEDLGVISSALKHEPWIKQLFAAVAGLSCLFTTANVIIYFSLRNFLNVSGWVEFAYFLALGIYSALSIPALVYEPTSDTDHFCYVLSVCLQFFEIATYTSFAMIAFDVYWMIRKSDAFGSYGEDVEESKLRLVVYYFIMLAIPIGVITYGLVLNTEALPKEYAIYKVPSYGLSTCLCPPWLLHEYLIFGLESFTFLVILLSVHHVLSRLSKSAEVDDAPRVSLLSNLFFFTLTYWIMSLLQFSRPLFGGHYSENHHSPETFWIVLKGFDYGQGILIFIVFIFNRKTLRALKKKSGSDGTLREIFSHACCSGRRSIEEHDEGSTPMSPLMQTSSLRRSTVRHNNLY